MERMRLERIVEGDEIAFRQLMKEHAQLLGTFILGFTKSQEHTEEIVQDIFLQIWLRRKELTQIRNFKNYLYVISRNYALNAVRTMVREQTRFEKWQALNAETWVQDQPLGEQQPDIAIIEAAIQQLPAQQQKAWIMSRKQGLKHREIAEAMNISTETVKKYIQYANLNLHRYLNKRITVLLSIAVSNYFLE